MDSKGPEQSAITVKSGTSHAHRVSGPSVEIRSDFDHEGRVDLTDNERGMQYQEARAVRQRRAGSILLPILDPALSEKECCEEYLTPVKVRSLGQSLQQGGELCLRFEHRLNEKRVVGYRQMGNTWKHVLGLRPDGARPRGALSEAETIRVPAGWTGENVQLCAATLAGDPRRLGPVSVLKPPRESIDQKIRPGEVWMRLHHRRNGSNVSTDDCALFLIAPFLLQSNLEPADRLYAVDRRVTHNFVYDVMEACWTIFGEDRPFPRASDDRFSPSTAHQRRRGTGRTVDPDDEKQLSSDKMYLIDGEEYPNVWIQDQMAIGYCSAPGDRWFNVAVNCKRTSCLREFVSQEMKDADDSLFVFDGLSGPKVHSSDYGGNMTFSPPVMDTTDAQPPGHAGPRVPAHPRAPHGKIILGDCHNPSLQNAKQNREDGTVHQETRRFLRSQVVQPIVPIDTSWLAVGHVDEIMAFVPSPDSQNGPAKLAMASTEVMEKLLDYTCQEALVEDGRTHFHRGRHTRHLQLGRLLRLSEFRTSLINHHEKRYEEENTKSMLKEKFSRVYKKEYENISVGEIIPHIEFVYRKEKEMFADSYDETSVEDFCEPKLKSLNQNIQNEFLGPIEHRLCRCTGLDRPEDVLRLPVYFTRPSTALCVSEARTPNVVNMQVLKTNSEKTHLLVPRPYGPRLPPKRAEDVVRSVLEDTGQGETKVYPIQEEQDDEPGFQFWGWPTLDADTLALFFTRKKQDKRGKWVFVTENERAQMIEVIAQRKPFDKLPPHLQTAAERTKRVILEANPEAEKSLSENKLTGWHRLFIPEDTIDVIELYIQLVFEKIGCEVHFVDSWYHHCGGGGVHCATNVLHRPPTAESLAKDGRSPWWEDYPELAAADTFYNPFKTAH